MNQNDLERYFQRTGHPWMMEYRLFKQEQRLARPKLTKRTAILIVLSSAVTIAVLLFQR